MQAKHWPRLPALDARLGEALQMADDCRVCADIGADHGRLSAALLASGKAEHVLVSDVSEKSLQKAKRTLQSAGLQNRVTFAVADGLAALSMAPDQTADTIFLLGLGGETLARILREGQNRLRGATLILGAQTDLPLLRQTVCDIGYRLADERVANENGRSYILMRCRPALEGEAFYDERERMLGPLLLRKLPPLYQPMLKRREALLKQTIPAMANAEAERRRQRLAAAKRELAYVQEALGRYDKEAGE